MATVIHRGMMRQVIALENPVKTLDAGAGHRETYGPYVELRGYLEKKSGFRQLEEGRDGLISEYECWIPWRNEFETNLTKDTRIVNEGRRFKIVSKERYQYDRFLIKMTLIEVE